MRNTFSKPNTVTNQAELTLENTPSTVRILITLIVFDSILIV